MADELDPIAEKAVRAAAAASQAAIIREAPAYLAPFITVKVTGAGRKTVATLQARGLSSIVLAGQRAHVIAPVAGRALFWPGAPHPVGVSHHPMVPSNDFMTRGQRAGEVGVNKAVDLAAEAMADVLGERTADAIAEEFI